MRRSLIRLFIINGAFVAAALVVLLLLTTGLSATFAAAAIGTAVMLLPEDEHGFQVAAASRTSRIAGVNHLFTKRSTT
ncbi:MAG: hypothetical protein EA385_11890 [Salinarimonadaceae bacterium]|nr:MAG: hypothetical protein EA385_11890 [Salinarimonadaceae bacterium]